MYRADKDFSTRTSGFICDEWGIFALGPLIQIKPALDRLTSLYFNQVDKNKLTTSG